MADVNGKNLAEPTQVDWDKVGGGSFTPPPAAKDASGNYIKYFGKLPLNITEDVDNDQYRTYTLDPIKIVQSGEADGYELRFSRTSLKPFKNGNNSTAILIKAAGISAKPQKTAEYDSVIKQVKGKVVPLTLDWVARNKDTGEQVRGYENFPDDPTRPGKKKAILKAGDTYKDADGNEQVVQSEVLFANAQLRFFEIPKKG